LRLQFHVPSPPAARALRLALLILAALPAVAVAQEDEPPQRRPIGRFAADVRASIPRFKEDPNIAAAVGVIPENLATRGLGVVVGAHVYPISRGSLALGIGGEALFSRASRTLEPATEDGPDGPTASTSFSALSPQLSLNFGASEGWSYISGGMGWSRFSVRVNETPGAAAGSEPRRKTINYGGGARWFTKRHLALSIDLRWYAVSPQLATAAAPALPRMTVMVFSVGAGFK
jgi:hypothetical protein